MMTVNGRTLSIADIRHGRVDVTTAFEADLFSFVREWFGDAETFDFQTSGSTGDPTRVTFTRDQLIASARRSVDAFSLRPGDTALVCLSTRYVAGKMMLVRAFVNRMKVIAVEPSSNPLTDVYDDIDFIAIVPLQLQTMIEAGLSPRLNRVRTIIVGGAPMSPALREQVVRELSGNVYLTYGMTETLTHVALDRVTGEDAVFTALPGVAVGLDDRGCLVIQSDVTAGAVVTNDLGELVSEGAFRWLGRYDNVINSGGVKFIPEVIERKATPVFARLNIQNNFFVAGIPHDRLGNEVAMFIEGTISQEEQKLLEQGLYDTLDTYEKPGKVIFLSDFVYTESGKINRKQSIRRHRRYSIEKP